MIPDSTVPHLDQSAQTELPRYEIDARAVNHNSPMNPMGPVTTRPRIELQMFPLDCLPFNLVYDARSRKRNRNHVSNRDRTDQINALPIPPQLFEDRIHV